MIWIISNKKFDDWMNDTLVETPVPFGIPPGLNKDEIFGEPYEQIEDGTSHFFCD